MRGACQDRNCTFNVTKQCVRGLPPEECTHRLLLEEEEPSEEEEEPRESFADERDAEKDGSYRVSLSDPVLQAPDEIPRLPESRTLGIAEVNAMMEARPTCMIGIVGLPGAGKTACLVSAYLLLAKGQFEGFGYADSATLRAFEDVARGSRTWVKGNPPEQITSHTELQNEREAGFLHLLLRREVDGKLFDLLFPDLPGEWSKELIDLDDSKRLEFLRSAAVIWFMVDGRQFTNDATVSYARYRAELLLERLAALLGPYRPRVLVVPTWQDAGVFPKAEADRLTAAGTKWGFGVEISPIASFSWNDAVPPGDGVAKLVARSIEPATEVPEFWPTSKPDECDRAMIAFRGRP